MSRIVDEHEALLAQLGKLVFLKRHGSPLGPEDLRPAAKELTRLLRRCKRLQDTRPPLSDKTSTRLLQQTDQIVSSCDELMAE